jgi:fucose permease
VSRFRQSTGLLLLIYLCFISLGLPDGVLGASWPAIRADLGQPLAAVGWMTLTVTICAGLSSWFAAPLTRRWGTGPIVVVSGGMTTLALLGFAFAPTFGWLLLMAVPLGWGAGAVDASANHFVAKHCSARHMNWLHGSWGIGASTGPVVMGAVMVQTGQWTSGVLTLGLIQLSITAVLWIYLPLWRRPISLGHVDQPAQPPTSRPARQDIPSRAAWMAPMCFLFYVGAEAGVGLWAVSILVQERGLSLVQAGMGLSLYFGAITLGRFAVGLVAHRMHNRQWVKMGLGLALLGASLFALPLPGSMGLLGLVLMGWGCAPIFPSLMAETTERFPAEMARTLVSRQMVFSYLGGSLVPASLGLLATWIGLTWVMPGVILLLLGLLVTTQRLDRIT